MNSIAQQAFRINMEILQNCLLEVGFATNFGADLVTTKKHKRSNLGKKMFHFEKRYHNF